MTQFWFVSYITRFTKHEGPDILGNAVLAGVHPLVWISNSGPEVREHMTSWALHFHEIDEATFNEVRRMNYMEVADYRETPMDLRR